jgi:hypothetical protein
MKWLKCQIQPHSAKEEELCKSQAQFHEMDCVNITIQSVYDMMHIPGMITWATCALNRSKK